jgi:hypothetical protein
VQKFVQISGRVSERTGAEPPFLFLPVRLEIESALGPLRSSGSLIKTSRYTVFCSSRFLQGSVSDPGLVNTMSRCAIFKRNEIVSGDTIQWGAVRSATKTRLTGSVLFGGFAMPSCGH